MRQRKVSHFAAHTSLFICWLFLLERGGHKIHLPLIPSVSLTPEPSVSNSMMKVNSHSFSSKTSILSWPEEAGTDVCFSPSSSVPAKWVTTCLCSTLHDTRLSFLTVCLADFSSGIRCRDSVLQTLTNKLP